MAQPPSNPRALSSFTSLKRSRLGGADIALAALVVMVVAMMIVPLPTWLLDILIATNLSASVALLLVVLYSPDALAIATFPTILLLTTLFRLALNVSSTRLILLQANAGRVIAAFGHFVVRGNYVVGAVVFLILTIIQFIVIAKGSERVAEVGARFVLDAMPGKQMAIDAELRSGSIDGAEAKRRRRALSRESQFYGAMDGAMKFVKGDVIASLIICVINILGGLAIGMAQHDMSAVDALKKYGLLTIGDGLVSQIPALVLSTAAGVLVTRTASEEPDTPLGEEISRQIFAMPKALRAASAFVFLLAIVPGFPAIPFVAIGVLLLVVARSRSRSLATIEERDEVDSAPKQTARAGARFVPVVVPWSFDVGRELEAALDANANGSGQAMGLRAIATSLRDELFSELGVPFPAARFRVNDAIPPRHVVLSIHEVPAKVFVVPEGDDDEAAAKRIADETLPLLRARAADFLGLAETQRLLDELEQIAAATVRNVVPKPVSLTLLADVLRRLVEEGVSIRDLRAILEALSTVAHVEKDPLQLAEFVRAQLRRAITFRLTRGASQLSVHLLDPTIEDTIRRAITRTANGAFLTLPPSSARDIIAAIRRAFDEGKANEHAGDLVLLTQPDIRRFVRKLIDVDLPNATVVSFAELLPEVSLRPLARAHLGGIGN
jgi:type III secretion protein V